MPDRSTLVVATRHAAVVVLAMGTSAVVLGSESLATPASEALRRAPAAGAVSAASSTPRAVPTVVRIDGIDVDAPVVPLGLTATGELDVPDGRDDAGWWSGGSGPGEVGPMVIVGHVNLRPGPAVFHRLSEVEVGDLVTVDPAEGGRVTYRVTAIEQVDKDEFPTDRVYGATSAPTLRLVTCGGSFRRADRSYTDNVIVFADVVEATVSPGGGRATGQ